MKIISFIERCQQDVIERTLRHCGLWEGTLVQSLRQGAAYGFCPASCGKNSTDTAVRPET